MLDDSLAHIFYFGLVFYLCEGEFNYANKGQIVLL